MKQSPSIAAARALFRDLHRTVPAERRIAASILTMPGRPLALASVKELRVVRHGRVQIWRFPTNHVLPRLAYVDPSPSDARLKPTRFWIVGGAYRVDDDGLHARSGDGGIVQVPVATARTMPVLAEAVAIHRAGHGGLDPRVAVRAAAPPAPPVLVEAGPLAAIVYGDDKGDGDGFGPFIHNIKKPCRPDVYISYDGTQIYIVGGRMAVFEGWLHDVS